MLEKTIATKRAEVSTLNEGFHPQVYAGTGTDNKLPIKV